MGKAVFLEAQGREGAKYSLVAFLAEVVSFSFPSLSLPLRARWAERRGAKQMGGFKGEALDVFVGFFTNPSFLLLCLDFPLCLLMLWFGLVLSLVGSLLCVGLGLARLLGWTDCFCWLALSRLVLLCWLHACVGRAGYGAFVSSSFFCCYRETKVSFATMCSFLACY